MGPWGEAVQCVKTFEERLNKHIDQWNANIGRAKVIPKFHPANDDMSFLDELNNIKYVLTHIQETDEFSPYFKNYLDILNSEVLHFMENLRKLEIHLLMGAYTDKNGRMMVDVFKKYDGGNYKQRT
jgi:hypothetical protein